MAIPWESQKVCEDAGKVEFRVGSGRCPVLGESSLKGRSAGMIHGAMRVKTIKICWVDNGRLPGGVRTA